MSKLLDYTYINAISSRLERFSWTRATDLALCRCPICGDSKKKTTKRRLYFIVSDDHYSVYCQNCSYSNSFDGFLEQIDSELHKQYRLEKFKERGGSPRKIEVKPDYTSQIERLLANTPSKSITLDTCVSLQSLPLNSKVRQYVASRAIPGEAFDRLWFSPDFRKTVEEFSPDLDSEAIPSEPRLILPFIYENELNVLQGRSLDPNSYMRYITLRRPGTQAPKIFGMDKVDRSKKIIVVEGPIDSLFIPNCIATADSNLLSAKEGDILIPDNQYRSKEICKQIDKFIDSGKQVVLFPDTIKEKDINSMIVDGGRSRTEVLKLISQNVFSGLEAKMVWNRLRKV